MSLIFIGALAFVVLTMFDLAKLKKLHPLLNGLFAIGVLMIVYASLMILFVEDPMFTFRAFPIMAIVAVIGFVEMIYALFFALPFSKTYVKNTASTTLVTTGLYGLCRHPGVWGFFLFFFSTAFAAGNGTFLIASLVWTLMDVLHVYLQDTLFFVKTLEGYTQYQQRTPFLFFSAKDLHKAFTTLRKDQA